MRYADASYGGCAFGSIFRNRDRGYVVGDYQRVECGFKGGDYFIDVLWENRQHDLCPFFYGTEKSSSGTAPC